MNMVERAARALHDGAEPGVPWDELSVESRKFIKKMARAAIIVMRKPNAAMIVAVDTAISRGYGDARTLLEFAIDAALKE